MENPAPSSVPLHPLLAGRWSARAFDGQRTIDGRTMRGLLEAAIWAPSSGNVQPWRFIAGRRGADAANQARWQAIFDGLEPGNQRWCERAAALVVTLAQSTFESGRAAGQRNDWARHDVGAAGLSMALQAHAVGLHSHPMAGFVADRLRTSLAIPESLDIVTVWSVGYPGDPDALPEDLQRRELAPRTRRPLEEVVIGGL